MRRAFTPDEDAFIVASYSTMRIKEIAAALGRWCSVVQQRISILERQGRLDRLQRCYQRHWTEDDEEWLMEHWGQLADEAIARHLRRSIVAVALKAKRLSLIRKMAVYSSRDAARIFGVDSKTVLAWVERDWIAARRSPIRCGANRVWSIDEDSLERFVLTMGWAYDWRRMALNEYLTNLAERVNRADPWLTIPEACKVLGKSRTFVRRWITRGVLPCRRRPKQGQPGNPGGIIVIHRSDLPMFLDRYREIVHRNRSESARRQRRREREAA